jgi:hypothetical protein
LKAVEWKIIDPTLYHVTSHYDLLDPSIFQLTVGHANRCQQPSYCSKLLDGGLNSLDDLLWPLDRPLPYPTWGVVRSQLPLESIQQFESLIADLTDCIQRQLETHCYNTVGNFLTY